MCNCVGLWLHPELVQYIPNTTDMCPGIPLKTNWWTLIKQSNYSRKQSSFITHASSFFCVLPNTIILQLTETLCKAFLSKITGAKKFRDRKQKQKKRNGKEDRQQGWLTWGGLWENKNWSLAFLSAGNRLAQMLGSREVSASKTSVIVYCSVKIIQPFHRVLCTTIMLHTA